MDTNSVLVHQKLQQLKAVRKALGWSEETCAHHLGVTYSTINRWERGEVVPKSQAVLNAIDHFIAQYGQAGGST
jgi:DNA-binding transcriptional regulator YiaG